MQGRWIVDCIKQIRSQNLKYIDPKKEASLRWKQRINELSDASLFPTTKSTYMGGSMEGKAFEMTCYAGGIPQYVKEIRSVLPELTGFRVVKAWVWWAGWVAEGEESRWWWLLCCMMWCGFAFNRWGCWWCGPRWITYVLIASRAFHKMLGILRIWKCLRDPDFCLPMTYNFVLLYKVNNVMLTLK